MKGQVGSTAWIDHGEVESVLLADERPVVDARPAERVRADVDARLANRFDVDDVDEVVHVVAAEVVGLDARRLRAAHVRTAVRDDLVRAVGDPGGARRCLPGPPCGGLYLKPPSRGGLWLGVMMMPSACVAVASERCT